MTDTPPKPKRRGWRWLVVAVLLFVMAAVVAWYSSRMDPRFVGTWQVYDASDSGLVPNTVMEITAGGWATQRTSGVRGPSGVRCWIDGDDLVIDTRWYAGIGGMWMRLKRAGAELIGPKPPKYSLQRFKMKKVDPNELTVEFRVPLGSLRTFVWKRLPQ